MSNSPSGIGPCLATGRVVIPFPSSLITRERSAERRINEIHARAGKPVRRLLRSGVDIPARDAAPIGAPLAAIFGPGSVLPGAESGLLPR